MAWNNTKNFGIGTRQPELWTEEEREIFSKFHYRCGMCRIKPAITLHEIKPKSLEPRNWRRKKNRIPLCAECHETVHKNGTRNFAQLLIERVEEVWQ